MGTQKQSNGTNWYGIRFVLILIFLALYVAVPVIMIVLKDKWLNGVPNECLTWTLLGIAGVSLALLIIFLFQLKGSVKSALEEAIKNSTTVNKALNQAFAEGGSVEVALEKAFAKNQWLNDTFAEVFNNSGKGRIALRKVLDEKGVDVMEQALALGISNNASVKEALGDSFVNNENIKNAISSVFAQQGQGRNALDAAFEPGGKTRDALDAMLGDGKLMERMFSEAFKSQTMNSALKDALKQKVAEILDENDIKRHLLDEVTSMLENFKNERNAQKHRFAERVVEEICKGNKSGSIDICNLKGLIISILNDDKGCCVSIIKDGDKAKFVVTDKNCNKKTLVFDNTTKDFTPDGDFTLCDGFVVTIKGGKVESIEKSR